jgi:outer membrane protein TolC
MKIVYVFMISLSASVASLGQSVDYNKIILPDNAKDVSIEERLVQIAWKNNPLTAIGINNVEASEYRLKKSQWSWLDHLRVQGNLNEFTIKGRDASDPANRSNFYPRYNFSLNFSLGDFVSTPLENKIARESLQNEEENIKRLKLQIRGDVLRRYLHYKTSKELYQLQKSLYDDLTEKSKLTEKKFNNGEVSLNEYNATKDRYENQQIKKINAEDSYQQAKLDLEELLGLKMEEIL